MSERTIREICRDELLAIKVDVPMSVLAKRGDILIMSAFDWAMTVGERCREQLAIPPPLPWIASHLTEKQRGLDWREFCDPLTVLKKKPKQACLF